MTPERALEYDFKNFVRIRKGLSFKFVSPGCAGVPDSINVTGAGNIFFLEFKSPGKTPGKLQRYWIKKINSLSGKAHWTDNIEEAKRIYESYD